MDRGSYIAGNGMIAQQQRLDVIANNLANVNTRGFKADRLTFGDMMRRTLSDDAGYGDPIATLSAGPSAEPNARLTDFSEGGAEVTDNPLDVRLGGKSVAMFAVQHGGATLYTRNGAFTTDVRGNLKTQGGDAVLDDAGRPIGGLKGKVEIGKDGTVRDDGKAVAKLGVTVGSFQKTEDGDGLFTGSGVRTATANDDVKVASGELETSNVNPVKTMIEMIALQRNYEISQKMIQSQDDSTAKLAETMG